MALTGKSSKYLFITLFCLMEIAAAFERSKRELKFPEGTSLSMGVALLSLYPKGPLSEGFLQFLEFDLGYPLSEKFVFSEMEAQNKNDIVPGKWKKNQKKYIGTKKEYTKKYENTKRNSIENEKKNLLFKIQNAMIKLGYNGSACVSRLQCELKNVSPNNSLMEELLVELFRPSYNIPQKNCDAFTLNCPISLLHIMLHSEQILTV